MPNARTLHNFTYLEAKIVYSAVQCLLVLLDVTLTCSG